MLTGRDAGILLGIGGVALFGASCTAIGYLRGGYNAMRDQNYWLQDQVEAFIEIGTMQVEYEEPEDPGPDGGSEIEDVEEPKVVEFRGRKA